MGSVLQLLFLLSNVVPIGMFYSERNIEFVAAAFSVSCGVSDFISSINILALYVCTALYCKPFVPLSLLSRLVSVSSQRDAFHRVYIYNLLC